jgi:hypothetical protein
VVDCSGHHQVIIIFVVLFQIKKRTKSALDRGSFSKDVIKNWLSLWSPKKKIFKHILFHKQLKNI